MYILGILIVWLENNLKGNVYMFSLFFLSLDH